MRILILAAHPALEKSRVHRALLAAVPERPASINLARRRIEELEQMLKADLEAPPLDRDAGWDAESLREEGRGGQATPVTEGGA